MPICSTHIYYHSISYNINLKYIDTHKHNLSNSHFWLHNNIVIIIETKHQTSHSSSIIRIIDIVYHFKAMVNKDKQSKNNYIFTFFIFYPRKTFSFQSNRGFALESRAGVVRARKDLETGDHRRRRPAAAALLHLLDGVGLAGEQSLHGTVSPIPDPTSQP